jgi:hypothetical protein
MPTNTPGSTARRFQTSQTHYLRTEVNWNDPGIATGRLLGTLPETAQITSVHVNVVTAFNAATTNVLAVGTTATGAQIIAGTDAVAGTLGSKVPNVAGMALAPLAVDTPIFVSYTQSGTAATAGRAIVHVFYTVDNGTR